MPDMFVRSAKSGSDPRIKIKRATLTIYTLVLEFAALSRCYSQTSRAPGFGTQPLFRV